jgi:hypothetical protein
VRRVLVLIALLSSVSAADACKRLSPESSVWECRTPAQIDEANTARHEKVEPLRIPQTFPLEQMDGQQFGEKASVASDPDTQQRSTISTTSSAEGVIVSVETERSISGEGAGNTVDESTAKQPGSE